VCVGLGEKRQESLVKPLPQKFKDERFATVPSGDSDLDRESRDLNESSKVKDLKLHDFQMISHCGSGILL